jgi:hypothetical protein
VTAAAPPPIADRGTARDSVASGTANESTFSKAGLLLRDVPLLAGWRSGELSCVSRSYGLH